MALVPPVPSPVPSSPVSSSPVSSRLVPSPEAAIAPALEAAIDQIRHRLRPGQQAMADWRGGPLAVSAVPGSGKSTGMAGAAAIAVARNRLNLHRQLIVVTFTRSAATHLKAKIRQELANLSLPGIGFSVQTLHGLALAIAQRHPELSGLNLSDNALISPNQSHPLLRRSIDLWIAQTPQTYQQLILGQQFDGEETERLRRQGALRTEVLPALAVTVIQEAKSSGLLPEDLRQLAQQCKADYDLLAIAAGLYDNYQSLLRQQGLIDYDDMILAALRVLADPATRALWQDQCFAVFEDEAQDSTPLQTQLLEILAGHSENPEAPPDLIRVGDPNQAINSTFTPADPIFFRRFCDRCSRLNRFVTMDQAGRSSPIILTAANFLLDWVNHHFQNQSQNQSSSPSPTPHSSTSEPFAALLPFQPQAIRPVPPGDPQPQANPAPVGLGLELQFPADIRQTAERLGDRLIALFRQDPQTQAAILVRENKQGRWLAQQLASLETDHGIAIYEVGASDRRSAVPQEMLTLLQFLQRPHSPDRLKAALSTLVQRQLVPPQDLNRLASSPEQFLFPGPLESPQSAPVRAARRYCHGLLQARLALPTPQLMSFLAMTLSYDAAELATADKLADQALRRVGGNLSLFAIIQVIEAIVGTERFEPVDLEETESRYTRPGQLTIITLHKAKGLDWDHVFLPFLQAQTIPGNAWVPPQGKFLGDFTLAEVARAQIRAALHQSTQTSDLALSPLPGQAQAKNWSGLRLPDLPQAWHQANRLKQAEEYRLLYVAMTRAKRLLWMAAAQQAPFSWNKPDSLDLRPPCPALTALAAQFPGCIVSPHA